MKARIFGVVTQRVADILDICLPEDQHIYLGNTNVIHMQSDHPDDYAAFGTQIPEILAAPNYMMLPLNM